MSVRLRPLREDEYPALREHAIAAYASDMIENGGLPEDAAWRKSRADHASLLPEGLATPNVAVLAVEADGETVGSVLLGERTEFGLTSAFLYDIQIGEAHRGRGLGRLAVALVEVEARARGHRRLVLNVFGGNDVARGLYRSAGFRETAVTMTKDLE